MTCSSLPFFPALTQTTDSNTVASLCFLTLYYAKEPLKPLWRVQVGAGFRVYLGCGLIGPSVTLLVVRLLNSLNAKAITKEQGCDPAASSCLCFGFLVLCRETKGQRAWHIPSTSHRDGRMKGEGEMKRQRESGEGGGRITVEIEPFGLRPAEPVWNSAPSGDWNGKNAASKLQKRGRQDIMTAFYPVVFLWSGCHLPRHRYSYSNQSLIVLIPNKPKSMHLKNIRI